MTIEEIEYEIEQLGFEQDAYLRKHGWHYTSDTPSCIWLWTIEYKGRWIAVPKGIALSMQRWLDPIVKPIEQDQPTP